MWQELTIIGVIFVLFEIIGFLSAINAVMTTRTSQGAIGWSLALVTWPLFTVPLYWIFGRRRFEGYVNVRRGGNLKLLGITEEIEPQIRPFYLDLGAEFGEAKVLEKLTRLPFVRGNHTTLLIDGEKTFEAIFAAIDEAKEYVLVEFYIIRDDELGRELKQRLVNKARQGCLAYLLYDEVGSAKLTKGYLADLIEAGVHVSGMKTTRGWRNRFQLNFRNHRKIVVIDGQTAFVGGHNVGDEYVGRHRRLTPWRDTHMTIEGPAALAAQLAFVEDWYWATNSAPPINWAPQPSQTDGKTVFVLPSGPADEFETCGLFFIHAINCAPRRLWIASPYFVPDEGVVGALKLAAMRGVDVRIMIPGMADQWLIKLAAMSYVEEVTRVGVKMYEYGDGFLHQKVVLIDERTSTIGTANFDNRSFRLNFEISVVTVDEEFAREVEAMLETDFSNSRLIDLESLNRRSMAARVGCRIARLFSPIL